MTKRIIFFGTEDFSAISLQALIAAGFSIAAVVTKPDSIKGRGQRSVPPLVKRLAIEHDIPVWQPRSLKEIANDIADLQPVAGVLVSYGKIIPQSIIDLFTPGIINVHPSLLPEYRGPSPIEAAILSGQNTTGVSIMQLSAAMDAGPVYKQLTHALTGSETQSGLYDTLGKEGAALLVELLPSILDGTLLPTPQDNDAATYCQLIQKKDGVINWQKSAEQIEREIRAYSSWPQSRATLGDVELTITRARAIASTDGIPGTVELPDNDSGTLIVHTGNGSLSIESLKPAGKKEMPVKAFLAGYKQRLS